jgi:hypothetical protein
MILTRRERESGARTSQRAGGGLRLASSCLFKKLAALLPGGVRLCHWFRDERATGPDCRKAGATLSGWGHWAVKRHPRGVDGGSGARLPTFCGRSNRKPVRECLPNRHLAFSLIRMRPHICRELLLGIHVAKSQASKVCVRDLERGHQRQIDALPRAEQFRAR